MIQIQGQYDTRTQYFSFDLPLLGEAWSQGEMHLNELLNRYEHVATDADGAEYLIVSPRS